MSRFPFVEASDPDFEAGRLRYVTVRSSALGRRADLSLFVPPGVGSRRGVPLVILLHGIHGSHWSWALKGGAHKTALEMIRSEEIGPIVLAMPSDGLFGSGSGYLPLASGDAERWIVDEVPAIADEIVDCIDANSPRYLAGMSMGGFGALRIGAKHPGRFAGVSAHSPITKLEQLVALVEDPPAAFALPDGEPTDVLTWIERNRDALPRIRFDCGRSDELIGASRELHEALDERGIAHVYEEFGGGHTWDYWRDHLQQTLKFVDP